MDNIPDIPGYFTLTQAAAYLGLTRQALSLAAKAEKWKLHSVGTAKLVRQDDVYEYRDHRYRTELVKRLGWSKDFDGPQLYRDSDIDCFCPQCGAFAVEWPPAPALSETIICLSGHRFEIDEAGEVRKDESYCKK